MQKTTHTQTLSKLKARFERGDISGTWAGIRVLLETDLGPENTHLRNYLQLGCALYQVGDLTAARTLNRHLPVQDFTLLRYRLSLRLRDPLMARHLRLAPDQSPNAQSDFLTSAGLYLLWNHRYKRGFKFYQHRAKAINFGKILPKNLVYAPLPKAAKDDLNFVALEQGVGEVLFCLAHLKSLGGADTRHFLAEDKYRALVRRSFPKSRFSAFSELDGSWSGVAVHCAADYLARSFARNSHLSPGTGLNIPRNPAFGSGAVGICWRGGSGQNRREERHIPLAYFLDQLPKGKYRYVPLQFDLSDHEKHLLEAHPDCQQPIFDLQENPDATMQFISQLAGVISVDSANWHFAGLSGIPLLALMNQTSHWFWGPRAQVEDVYPSARTLPRQDLTPDKVSEFVEHVSVKYAQRPPEAIVTNGLRDRPIFVLGLPRSGTSMTTRVLKAHGVWLGETVPGTRDNKHGFFENRVLRDVYVKGILNWIGTDPGGVTSLPDIDRLPDYPHLRFQMLRALENQGYDGKVWAFKDPKLTLIWPILAQAFPNAAWVIVRRHRQAVIDSLCRTPFMARHSTSPGFWESFAQSYDWRLNRLRHSKATVYNISSDALATGDAQGLPHLLAAHGLKFDATHLAKVIDHTVFTTNKKAAPKDGL